MKHSLGLLVCFVACSSFGITFKQQAVCIGASEAALTCTTTIAVGADDAVVFLAPGTASYVVTSSCGLTFNPPSGYPNSPGLSTWLDVRVALHAPTTSSSCSITMTRAGGIDQLNQFIALTYSGVGSVGQSANRYGGTIVGAGNCPGGSSTTGVRPTSIGNFVVSAWKANIGAINIPTSSVTATSPAIQRSTVVGGLWILTAGDTLVTSGNVNTLIIGSAAISSPGNSNNVPCSMADVELVQSTATSTHTARISDATQTVLLANASGNNYVLPGSILSPTWCAYVMPIAGSVNQISVQSPATLNNQSNPIAMGTWQMSRVCQDSSGNYWADPPITGSGTISVQSTPTAIVVTNAAGRAQIPVVAHGDTVLGGKSVLAGKCSLPVKVHAARVRATDIVEHSTPDFYSPYVDIVAFSTDDAVEFEICNSSSRALIPRRAAISWRVAR